MARAKAKDAPAMTVGVPYAPITSELYVYEKALREAKKNYGRGQCSPTTVLESILHRYWVGSEVKLPDPWDAAFELYYEDRPVQKEKTDVVD